MSKNERIVATVREIENCYKHAGIPTRHTEAIRIKLKRIVMKFKELLSKRKVPWDSQRIKENQFAQKIQTLSEVAVNEDLLSGIQVRYLQDQRTVRKEYPYINPIITNVNEEIDLNDNHLNSNTFEQPNIDDIDMSKIVESHDPDYVFTSESDEEMPCRKKKEIPSELLQRISSTQASYRVSEKLIDVGIELAGGHSNEYGTSKSTLWKKITEIRSNDKMNILQKLKSSDSKIILQFDCKRYHKINQRHVGSDDRMIVLSHSEQNDIPLGLFVIPFHSGGVCSRKIVQLIHEFNLRNRLVGLVSDTENVNTGRFRGCCTLIESDLNRDLLHLMCRHHIYEVVLKAAFTENFGRSTGPSSKLIFKPLIDKWKSIEQNGFVYEPMENEFLNSNETLHLVMMARETLQNHAKNITVRHDYAEITDLCLKFLGVQTQISFRVVGAVDNARFTIYYLSIENVPFSP